MTNDVRLAEVRRLRAGRPVPGGRGSFPASRINGEARRGKSLVEGLRGWCNHGCAAQRYVCNGSVGR
jgi:hypothetical protein